MQGEEGVEQGRNLLGRLQSGRDRAAIAGVLQGAVELVHIVVERGVDEARARLGRHAGLGVDDRLHLTGLVDVDALPNAIAAISTRPPAPTWLFTMAAAAAAVALAVIFGIQHWLPAVVIFVSAAAGAVLRRGLARVSANVFLQPFGAAMLAGLVGALATRAGLSSSLRLVVVCPCMVLVPGPHFLNAALDLVVGRIHLGAARLLYASLVTLAISVGLLLGLTLLHASLPIDPSGMAVPLWQDVIAAGVAVACYSVFFSTPAAMLPWPVAVGMLAHAARWVAISLFGFGVAAGALVACVIASLILTPVARRSNMPLAAIGFAAVVSMIPGVYLFRMMSGLMEMAGGAPPSLALIQETISAATTASTIILAMSLGVIVPKMLVDRFVPRSTRPENQGRGISPEISERPLAKQGPDAQVGGPDFKHHGEERG